jgi:16S rRNA (guanine527-N7)-methyltransferase
VSEVQTQRRLLDDGIDALGLDISESARARLLRYLDELVVWNRAYNLTALRDPDAMVVRHLLDCLSILPALSGRTIVDIGSGPGLPGLVIATARPRLAVTLVESNHKKCAFLRHVRRELGLDNIEIAQSRTEQLRSMRRFDTVTARAFADVAEIIAATGHLLADGGEFVLMKGREPSGELADLPAAYRLVEDRPVTVPGLDAERHVIRIRRALI